MYWNLQIKCAICHCTSIVCVVFLTSSGLAQNGLPVEYKGSTDGGYFGHCVISGHDVNGDGYDDILASDRTFSVDGHLVGRSIMLSGSDGSELWRFVGPQPRESGTLFYITSTFIDDIDGDLFDDVVIGTPGAGDGQGRVDVLSGHTGETLYSFVGHPGNLLGRDVGAVGDVDGDGTPDFGYVSRYSQDGAVSIRSGRDGGELLTLSRAWPRCVAGIGDVNDDRHDDVAVGSWYQQLGRGITVYSGDDGAVLYALDAPIQSDDLFGWAIVGGVDFTGDDRPDLVASGWRFGRAYVFSGVTGDLDQVLVPYNSRMFFGITLALGDVTGDGAEEICVSGAYGLGFNVFNPQTGAVLYVSQPISTENGAVFGNELTLGDINGDGILDFVLGQAYGPGSVVVDAGSPLMLSPADGVHRFGRGQDHVLFLVYNSEPNQRVYLLATQRGIECTFNPRLNICIDLRRPLQVVGSTITDENGFGTIDVSVPDSLTIGSVYLQALDRNHPQYGPLTSGVLQMTVTE